MKVGKSSEVFQDPDGESPEQHSEPAVSRGFGLETS